MKVAARSSDGSAGPPIKPGAPV